MFLIRKMTKEDIPRMVSIQVNGWQTAYRGIIDDSYLDTMNQDAYIAKRKKDYQDTVFIVAENENGLLGYCRYIDDCRFSPSIPDIDCELIAIYVDSTMKRQGIGQKLFEYTKKDLLNRGKTNMILWCLENNASARKFYEKMGGKIINTKAVDIGGKIYTEVGFLYHLDQLS